MRRGLLTWVMLIFFTAICTLNVQAAAFNNSQADVKIDGNFSDWEGKPELNIQDENVKDPKYIITDLRYITDSSYLYLYVKRSSGAKSDPWHFSVVITNAASGKNEYVDLFNTGKKVLLPVFDVTTTFDKGLNLVNVGYNGTITETTMSASNNGKEIEFRIPLSIAGLDGFSEEVQFALLSDAGDGTSYWVPGNYPITITTGPTGWQYTSALLFIGVSCMAFAVYRKSRVSESHIRISKPS